MSRVDSLLPELAQRNVLRAPDGPLDAVVPASRPVTAHDLLTFIFGFGMTMEMFERPWPVAEAADELELATLGPPMPQLQPDPDTWIERLGSLPLIAQPGERWLYNTGASVVGVLIARAAGQPLAEVMRTRIFAPLGMHDTAFWTSDTDRLATAYRNTPDGLVVHDPPDGDWSRPPAFGDAAAGLLATVDDLHAFARMLLERGGDLLSAGHVHAMCSDQLTPAQKASDALEPGFFERNSWGYCQAVYAGGAFGWDGGFGSSLLVDPVANLVVIVLTQRLFDSPALPRVHREIRAAAYGAL